MEAGELNDDDPRHAPLPAHERGWRHPSELGNEAWLMSEQPIMLGRGLTATTGAIVVMIALAVLWTMVPTQAGRTAVVSVRSTLATSSVVVNDSLRLPTDTSDSSAIAASTVPPATVVPTTLSSSQPMPTYNLQKTKTLEGGAVAVAVSGSSLIITTAFAVESDNTVQLLLDDGSTEMAEVLFVDQASGLAVLATQSLPEDLAFKVAEIEPGDELTLIGDTTHSFTVGADGIVTQESTYDDSVREGTPVMNQHGDLVGLCSNSKAEHFVALGDLALLHRSLAGWSGKIWMGIVFDTDADDQILIESVDPDGPAATAGLRAGDIILAINSAPVADNATFVEALAGLMPGDSVQLTVRNSYGEQVDVVLQLASLESAG
ncbi:MAG: PDZ domain-containing protein [Ilumatobacteraceae bacterium]